MRPASPTSSEASASGRGHRRHIARWWIGAALVGGLLLIGAGPAAAQEGGDVYQARCAGCHGVDGGGSPGLFPPLTDKSRVGDADYLADVIRNGLQGEIVVDGVTYNSVMPGFGDLGDAEVAALVDYIQNELLGPPSGTTTEPPGPTVPVSENAVRGENLFTGAVALAGGGPACTACHGAGSHGTLSGPSLGGDLTTVVAEAGGVEAAAALLHLPGRSAAAPIYEANPLTQQEAADLVAYLEAAGDEDRRGFLDGLVIIGLGALLALVAFTALVRPVRSKETS